MPGWGRLVPTDTIPVSTEAALQLQADIDAAIEQAQQSGEITIVIDEVELTSLVTFELLKIQEPRILEPQIYLRDGQVLIYAKLQQGNVSSPLQLIMNVRADENGYPEYEVVTALLGPVSFADSILTQLKDHLDSIILEKIRSQPNRIFIKSIEIANGLLTIQGQTR